MRCIAVLMMVTLAVNDLTAQPMMPQSPASRPAVSPYVNLLRGSNGGLGSPALNYYGIVRPEQQFRQQANSMQQQLAMTNQNLNNVQQAVASADGTNAMVTGKGATFMNYSHYFNNINGGGGGGGGGFGGSGGMSSGFNISRSSTTNNSRGGVTAPQGGRSGGRR